jgi:hypothetical protein
VSCWQWSDVSQEDAQRAADAHAVGLARKLAAGVMLDRYSYGERPLREEIVQRMENDAAVVTRNLYGALILNASKAMFIDVDFSAQGKAAGGGGFFGKLFGKKSAGNAEEECLKRVRAWAAEHQDIGLKVYRTFAGLRCLAINQTFDPSRAETIELLTSMGSDPLYVRLCKDQECFRARLTPKPWRCGKPVPPVRYPLKSDAEQAAFNRWRTDYELASRKYCVCKVVETIGPGQVHPEIAAIVELHDRFACEGTERPLA